MTSKTKIVVMSEEELENLIERVAEKTLEKKGKIPRNWLNQNEACEYLRVSRSTLYVLEATGDLIVYRNGKNVRYLISDLDNVFFKKS
ncbi:helix-turn-helix domain-containing protein [Thalassospira sp. MA62]|nr:helix-turn-helix domain-containing protein [Thalassospira sp. MA62]